MVLTASQIQAFLEDGDQMGIPRDTFIQLQNEDISTITDLVDLDKDTIKQIADNLRRPSGWIQYPTPGAAAGATIPTPPFLFGAIYQKCLLTACDLMRYYDTTGRPLTPGNIASNPIMRNFAEQ